MTERSGDAALAEDLLSRMERNHADFTLTFFRLREAAAGVDGDGGVRALFTVPEEYDQWQALWRARLQEERRMEKERSLVMRAASPLFIPRNHLVEEALTAAAEREDFKPFE